MDFAGSARAAEIRTIERVSEFGFNAPSTTRSYGDGTSV